MINKGNYEELGNNLLLWFKQYKRQMPWRKTKDPYTIWLSEIILQQTQIAQGTPYFEKFITGFPLLKNLAESSEDKVLKLWQGLGYYSRARNMLETAKHIYYNLGGKFPGSFNELLKLKGIGEYTAAAISSICYNEPIAVIDGNVIRVISRFFEINEPFNSANGKKLIKGLANQILDASNPAEHNQAMMELGSLICKPQNPLCSICPIAANCMAHLAKTVSNYPVKTKKNKSKIRYFNFIVPILSHSKTFITKRTGNDIWENMFTFPLHETGREIGTSEFIPIIKQDFADFDLLKVTSFNHTLSHQLIKASFYLIDLVGCESNEMPYRVSDTPQHYEAGITFKKQNNQISTDLKNKFTYQKNNIFEVEINSLAEHYSLPRIITKFMESNDVSFYFKV